MMLDQFIQTDLNHEGVYVQFFGKDFYRLRILRFALALAL
jgi:hypothetical protein